MEIVRELLPGVFVLKANKFEDRRGCFEVPFHRSEFEALTGQSFPVDQAMWASSKRYVIRGLHYQAAFAPVAKIVTCTMGVIYDVVVDLRHKEPSFGAWICFELSEADDYLLYVPAGLAHGYLSLSEQSGVFYYQSGFYDPAKSRILAWNDPILNIRWPLAGNKPILSERDGTRGISWAEYKVNPEY